jgi:hypothetical protein
MEIRIGNSHVPGNETVRADFNPFFNHDKGAIQQGEITYRALTIFSHRKRTTGVARDMVTDYDGARRFIAEEAENLGRLAIESFAELHSRRDRLGPPIAIDVPIWFDIAHVEYFPEA